MDARSAFRAGFMLRCADEGLSKEAIDTRIAAAGEFVKSAQVEFLAKPVVGGLKATGGLAVTGAKTPVGFGALAGGLAGGWKGVLPGGAAGYALAHPGMLAALGLGIPAVGGAAIGHLAAKSNSDPLALASANAEELMGEYDRLANQETRRRLSEKRE